MVTELEVGNSLRWIKVSDGIPAACREFMGAEVSMDVLVQYANGEQGVDHVYFPHGIFGHSTVPRFIMRGYDCAPEWEVQYWFDCIIPDVD